MNVEIALCTKQTINILGGAFCIGNPFKDGWLRFGGKEKGKERFGAMLFLFKGICHEAYLLFYFVQFSILKPSTLSNSFTLFVTKKILFVVEQADPFHP